MKALLIIIVVLRLVVAKRHCIEGVVTLEIKNNVECDFIIKNYITNKIIINTLKK